MTVMPRQGGGERKLRILHVLRAPVGGLFRHVVDLAYEQVARGHAVGLVVDSLTGGARGDAALAALEPVLALGLVRLPMRRPPHISDLSHTLAVALRGRKLKVDVLHAHGSKGGVYARAPGFIPGFQGPVRAYTPHGGSFNYPAPPYVRAMYMAVERLLVLTTDLFLLESHFIGRRMREELAEPHRLTRYVVNGLKPAEFVPVTPAPDAADFVYVGELRDAKGVDTLIDAFAILVNRHKARGDRLPRIVLVGSGMDHEKLMQQAADHGLQDLVAFAGVMPARDGFRLGRILVVPSRADSLPYVVIEGAGARIPIIATNVGGIGEIVAPFRDRLIPCDDADIMAATLDFALQRPYSELEAEATQLHTFVAARFTIDAMVDEVLAGYAEALARKHLHGDAARTALPLPS